MIIKSLILPPHSSVIGLVLVLFLAVFKIGGQKLQRLWLLLAFALSVMLYIISMPIFGTAMLDFVQIPHSLNTHEFRREGAQAIVILSAGRERYAPQFGGEDVDALTLVRLHYGARLSKRTRLPVLVSGGLGGGKQKSLAALMAGILHRDFGCQALWVEGASRNTWQNAQFSAKILRETGISKVALVTHAWHMRRAIYAFEQAGIEVLPAGTAFVSKPIGPDLADFLPSSRALQQTYFAFHEILGSFWYRVRY